MKVKDSDDLLINMTRGELCSILDALSTHEDDLRKSIKTCESDVSSKQPQWVGDLLIHGRERDQVRLNSTVKVWDKIVEILSNSNDYKVGGE